MEARLIPIDDWARGETIVVDDLPATIGRGPEARIRLDDRWASRRHCELDVRNGALVVRDLGSNNGTLINGCYVTHSVVEPGEKLTVGMSTFLISYERAPTLTAQQPDHRQPEATATY
jgi:pSer/pThr/pTyr-binding forkhead associated (FHA) protein